MGKGESIASLRSVPFYRRFCRFEGAYGESVGLIQPGFDVNAASVGLIADSTFKV